MLSYSRGKLIKNNHKYLVFDFYYSLLNFNILYRDNAITTTITATIAIAVMILGVELITFRHGTSIPCSFAYSEISPGFFDINLENQKFSLSGGILLPLPLVI